MADRERIPRKLSGFFMYGQHAISLTKFYMVQYKVLMQSTKAQVKGFTVVELLVVVAIIVTLTALLIFAFGDWRKRTADTEVKTALNSLATSLKNERNFKNAYPTTAQGIPATYKPSDGVTIGYTGTTTSYCASGTSTAESTVVWYISSTNQVPSKTAC